MNSIFKNEFFTDTLGELVSKAGLNQLRIAETEKYPHVTFFFNGGNEKKYKNEHRILVPSPKVATYDLKPEMAAKKIEEILINLTKAIKELNNTLKNNNISTNKDVLDDKPELKNKRIKIHHTNAINSPMVGTVYLSPEPGAKNFVKPGQLVKKGETLLIIEAMKTFNEIKAPRSGIIKKIVTLNSQPVEYGDTLIIFE